MNPTLLGFIKKELRQAVRDPRMRVMLFVMPVVQMALFGLALSNEVRNVRLGVIGSPGDVWLRHINERALASGWFVPAKGAPRDPFEWVRSGDAHAVLVAPEGGLTRAVERGDARLQLLIDASNAVRARAIEAYVQGIVSKVAADDGKGADLSTPAVSFDVRTLYNPSMRTAIFLVPGVMCLILCLLTVVLTSMSLAREKEMGTFETLISAPVKIWEILLGKTVPYILIGLLDVPLVIGVAVFLFDVPLRGAMWQLGLAALVFLAASVSAGTLISTYAKNQQQAMMGGFIFMFPAIQLSGIMFPLDNIPAAVKWVPYLNPLRYFTLLLRNIMLKGGGGTVFWENLAGMVALGAVMSWISFRRFRRTLN